MAGTNLTYQVSRGGQEIGQYRFSIDDQAGRREVLVEMSVKVKLLLVTIYEAKQRRRDVWENGLLESSEAVSVYNGKTLDLDLSRVGERYVSKVNGTVEALAGPVITFVPWWLKLSGKMTLVSERGRTDEVTISPMGPEVIRLGGQSIQTNKYQLTGRKIQELWYDEDGMLVLARFENRGVIIDVKRKMTP